MRPAKQLQLDFHAKLIVDLFAGGGGMSTAFEMAFGRSPDIAINHNDDALSMHRVNHPQTRHFVADVYEVCPHTVTQGRPVGWLHASPDCTHHSQAAGGQPRSKKIRGLAWVAYRWAGQVMPDVISLENVRQILKWGPLIAKRDKATGRCLKRVVETVDGKEKVNFVVAERGERVPVQDQFLIPNPKRVDIGLRMLDPSELYRANDFPASYIIDRGHDGRKFSKSAQVRMVGNSVDPVDAADFLEANAPWLSVRRAA